jgi:hypothetical protein
MISRRIATFLLGLWIGGCVLVDLLALQTGHSAEQFLNGPGEASAFVEKAGKDDLATILRHVELEDTRAMLDAWEWAQLGLAAGIGTLMLFSDQRKRLGIAMLLVMSVITIGQAFLITPQWTDFGRELDFARQGAQPVVANRIAMLTQTYGVLEIVKLLVGGVLASYFFAMESTVKRRSKRQQAQPEGANVLVRLS